MNLRIFLPLVISLGVACALVTPAHAQYTSLSDFYEQNYAVPVTEHLAFEGIEIDGHLQDLMDTFKRELRYKSAGPVKGDPLMSGKFGNDKITVQFGTVPGSDLVYILVATFQPTGSWTGMQTKYENLKVKLISRYGEPTRLNENDPMQNLCVFVRPEGDITLSTNQDGRIRIYFVDKKNSDKARQLSPAPAAVK